MMTQTSIYLQAETLNRVTAYKYIGSTVADDGDQDEEITRVE